MKRGRLSILILLLLILSSVMGSGFLFWQEIRTANRTIQQAGIDNLHTTLTHLQNVLNTQLAADNDEDAKLSLSVSALHPGIRVLLLADENNSVMLANRYLWEGSPASRVSSYSDMIAWQVRQTQASSVSLNASLLSGYYPVTLRLVSGGLGVDRVGVLFIEYDLAPQLAKARHNAVVQVFSFGGLTLGVAIVVAMLLHWLVSRRVEKIVDASKRFAAGDLNARVHLHGSDELAELGHAFDYMAGQRKEAQEALSQLNAELERRVAQRTAELETAIYDLENFNYSASHDLRIPLRAIDGFSKILLDEHSQQLDAEGKRLLNVVRDSSKKMAQFIDDMLAFSRTGRMVMTPVEINMDELVQEVMEELKPATAGREFEFEINKLPHTIADRAMMRQVFVSLLSNAIKFSRPKEAPRIQVGAFIKDDETVYYVRDNGVGFDMQYVGKLFGVFQRLHSVTEFEGTGIGLVIVKRIINCHGGRVWAEGKVNEGAAIYFTLPTKEREHG